jgi:hypothetical protein
MITQDTIIKRRVLPLAKEPVAIGLSILLAFFFSLHGSSWGRVEDWHPDQMAFKNLPLESMSLVPVSYQKPPFHSYFSLIARLPAKGVAYVLQSPPHVEDAIELLFVRMLTVFLFAGSVFLVFNITRRSFGSFSAIVLSFVFASSAGFVAFSHFLTADIPVTFWMLLALFFSIRILYKPKLSHYLLAGFFTGIATATKYNGLGVGISLAAAHLLSSPQFSWRHIQYWKRLVFDKKIIVGLLMVPIGFLAGNPYALFDYARFTNDFMYNLAVTPVYSGETGGNGYLLFFGRIIELIGWPAFIILCFALLFSLSNTLFAKGNEVDRKVQATLWATFLVYYLYIGSFPRLETRFVLPIVPVGLIISGSFLRPISGHRRIWLASLAIILSYNFISSYIVGDRFLEDPRMDAQIWVMNTVSQGTTIESSGYVPEWNRLEGVSVQEIRMPFISGRRRLFEGSLGGDKWVETSIDQVEVESQELLAWYSIDELLDRGPDYVAINSLYYERYMHNPHYPELKDFFTALLETRTCYSIQFQQETKAPPFWIYPQEIDTLENTMTILERCSEQ